MKKILIYNSLILAMIVVGCTTSKIKKANEDYLNFRYQDAIKGYTQVLKKENDTCAMKNLAHSYYKINETEKALEWYDRVLTFDHIEAPYILDYVKILVSEKEYDKAKVWLDVYSKRRPSDPIIDVLEEDMANSADYVVDSFMYQVKLLNINSNESSFSPVYYKEGIVFASQRPISGKNEQDTWTGESCFNLFYAQKNGDNEFAQAELFSRDLKTPLHEGPASFDKSGNTIYFTRSNMHKNHMQTSQENENNLEIYTAEFVDGKWTNITKFPFDADEYSLGHPTVTPDGNTMIFASNKDGGIGQTDLYVSKKINGEWTQPENLGELINSSGKDMFPYLHTNTEDEMTLYFATDGKPGLGGLDIYYSKYQNGQFSAPVHMSYPINTPKDDFGIAVSEDGKRGYLSSNRNNTEHGYDRIYEYEVIDQHFFVDITVKDKDTREIIPGAKVKLENLTLSSERNGVADEKGKVFFELEQNSEFSATGRKKDYFNDRKTVSTMNLRRTDTLELDLYLARLEIEKPIRLDNIYYDFDKWDIRPDAAAELDRLVLTLNENPKVIIELSSHTDARGSDKYNLKLSERRAKSAVDYIISKGISKKRMTSKGYGETKLLNECKNGVECDDDKHQFNRRTEFKVLSK